MVCAVHLLGQIFTIKGELNVVMVRPPTIAIDTPLPTSDSFPVAMPSPTSVLIWFHPVTHPPTHPSHDPPDVPHDLPNAASS